MAIETGREGCARPAGRARVLASLPLVFLERLQDVPHDPVADALALTLSNLDRVAEVHAAGDARPTGVLVERVEAFVGARDAGHGWRRGVERIVLTEVALEDTRPGGGDRAVGRRILRVRRRHL